MKKPTILSLILAFSLATFCLADPDPNLVGWWRFDEGSGSDANDSSGNDNNGTLNGNPQWVAGKIEPYALDFDGSGDYVDVPGSGSLDFSRSFTISAWLAPTATPSAQMSWFGYYDVYSTGRSINLRAYPNGRIRFDFYNNILDTAEGVMSFGSWNHIVATYDYDTDTSAIYVNGEKSESFINHPLQDGFHYKAEFITKAYDDAKDSDFLPEK